MIKDVIFQFETGKGAIKCDDIFQSGKKIKPANVTSMQARVDTRDSSLSILGDMFENLRILKLDNSIISSVRDIGCTLRNLRVLSVANCGISSLNGISTLSPCLEELYLPFNKITDVSDLMGMDTLRVLDLEGNAININDIDYLMCCSNLKTLILLGNPAANNSQYKDKVRNVIPQLEQLDVKKSPVPEVSKQEADSASNVKEKKKVDEPPKPCETESNESAKREEVVKITGKEIKQTNREEAKLAEQIREGQNKVKEQSKEAKDKEHAKPKQSKDVKVGAEIKPKEQSKETKVKDETKETKPKESKVSDEKKVRERPKETKVKDETKETKPKESKVREELKPKGKKESEMNLSSNEAKTKEPKQEKERPNETKGKSQSRESGASVTPKEQRKETTPKAKEQPKETKTKESEMKKSLPNERESTKRPVESSKATKEDTRKQEPKATIRIEASTKKESAKSTKKQMDLQQISKEVSLIKKEAELQQKRSKQKDTDLIRRVVPKEQETRLKTPSALDEDSTKKKLGSLADETPRKIAKDHAASPSFDGETSARRKSSKIAVSVVPKDGDTLKRASRKPSLERFTRTTLAYELESSLRRSKAGDHDSSPSKALEPEPRVPRLFLEQPIMVEVPIDEGRPPSAAGTRNSISRMVNTKEQKDAKGRPALVTPRVSSSRSAHEKSRPGSSLSQRK